jgi:hypothetical protein
LPEMAVIRGEFFTWTSGHIFLFRRSRFEATIRTEFAIIEL